MSEKQTFVLHHAPARHGALEAIKRAPDGYVCEVRPPKRNGDQNRKFHAICRDIALSTVEWAGKRRSEDEWKFLLVSGHAVATKRPGEFMLGLEQERMMLRPSTATMSVGEMTSLIEYAISWAASHGVELKDAT